jgi:hypothetical protein
MVSQLSQSFKTKAAAGSVATVRAESIATHFLDDAAHLASIARFTPAQPISAPVARLAATENAQVGDVVGEVR